MTDPTAPVPATPSAGGDHRSVLASEDGRSIGQLLTDVTGNVSTLMRQEVALAKAEVRQSARRAGKGTGLLVGAAVGALLFLVFLSVSAAWGIGQHIGVQWGALIVAAVWAVIALVLALTGKKSLDSVNGVPETVDTLSKVPNALKGQEENNR